MTQRFLIVRLSAIGDSILSVPVLTSLRKHFPSAKIAWVTERASAQLIEGHEALDDLFVVSKRTFQSAGELWALRKQLLAWKPDVSIDLQGLTKSSCVAWLSGAKRRLGFHRGRFDGRELSTWFNNHLFLSDAEHIVDRGLELLSLLGIQDKEVHFALPELDAEKRGATEMLSAVGIDASFAIINVGAGWPSKIWPTERYANVAEHMGLQHRIPSLVVWSGEQERLLAEQVVQQSCGHGILAPATTLTQLRSLIRRSRLFVGSDTGPMHLSVAVGTPTVGMIGPMPLNRVTPYGPMNIGLQRDTLASDQLSKRKTDCTPMLSIQVEDVVQACDTILNRSPVHNIDDLLCLNKV
jgi:heptosyltransferase I